MRKPLIFETYEIKSKSDQCWKWRLLSTNGRVIAMSGEPFHKRNIRRAINAIAKYFEKEKYEIRQGVK